MNPQSKKKCAHEDCECRVSAASVVQDGKRYCSQGCADGNGCDHLDCGCRAESEMEVGGRPRSTRSSAAGSIGAGAIEPSHLNPRS